MKRNRMMRGEVDGTNRYNFRRGYTMYSIEPNKRNDKYRQK